MNKNKYPLIKLVMVNLPQKLTKEQEERIATFLFDEISKNPGLTLREILKMAEDDAKIENYNDLIIRHILRLQEEAGKIYTDWDWKYKVAKAVNSD